MTQGGRAATKQEQVYPPNFAETTECRRKKLFRRISAASAFLGGKVFVFFCKDFIYN